MKVGEVWKSTPEFCSINVKIIRINEKAVVVLRPVTSLLGSKSIIEQVISKDTFLQNFNRSKTQ